MIEQQLRGNPDRPQSQSPQGLHANLAASYGTEKGLHLRFSVNGFQKNDQGEVCVSI